MGLPRCPSNTFTRIPSGSGPVTNYANNRRSVTLWLDLHKGVDWHDKEQTGRIDEDGNVNEGVGWNEKKVGRIPRKEQ